MQEFIESQQRTNVASPVDIDPEVLKNKLNDLSLKRNAENEFENKNKNGYSGQFNGSVALNGKPTIRSLKNMKSNNIFKFKTKKAIEISDSNSEKFPVESEPLSNSYVYIPKKPVVLLEKNLSKKKYSE